MGGNKDKVQPTIAPRVVAAITAALLAGGYLRPGDRITSIRPVGGVNVWRLAGIMELMEGRELKKVY